MRRRATIRAEIGDKLVSQPALYDAQVKALQHLLSILCKETEIPLKFPVQDDHYFTGLLTEDDVRNFKGILGKFNYFVMNHEPGAGFATALESLFGQTKPSTNQQVTEDSTEFLHKEPSFSLSDVMIEAREELSCSSAPTRSFLPDHEDLPRFNLSKAIASAYGKGGRAERMTEKLKKESKNILTDPT